VLDDAVQHLLDDESVRFLRAGRQTLELFQQLPSGAPEVVAVELLNVIPQTPGHIRLLSGRVSLQQRLETTEDVIPVRSSCTTIS